MVVVMVASLVCRSKQILLVLGLSAILTSAGCDFGTPGGEQLLTPVAQTPPLPTPDEDATVVAINNLAMQPTPIGRPSREELPPPDFDACRYLSDEEVEAAIGKPVTSSVLDTETFGTVNLYENEARCLYTGDGENLSLMVIRARDELEAIRLLNDQVSQGFGLLLHGVGDVAHVTLIQRPEGARTSNLAVKRGAVFFRLKWLSASAQDEIEALKKMAGAILSHVDSQSSPQGTETTGPQP
jgi:hypothetical protein